MTESPESIWNNALQAAFEAARDEINIFCEENDLTYDYSDTIGTRISTKVEQRVQALRKESPNEEDRT